MSQESSPAAPETARTESFLTRLKNLSFDTVATYIILGSVFVLPLFFIPAIGFSLDISRTLLFTLCVSLAALFWLLARLRSGSITVPLNPLFASALAIIAVFLASAFFSPSVPNSLYGFTYELGTVASIAALFVLFFLAALLFESHALVFRYYRLLLVALAVAALFEVIRLFFGPDALSFGGTFPSLADTLLGKWNDLGVFAGLTVLLSLITLEFLSGRRFIRAVAYGALVLSLSILAVVNFFLLWAIVGAFALVIFVYDFVFMRLPGRRGDSPKMSPFSWVAFAVLTASFVFLVAGNSLGAFISQKLNIIQLEVRPSWSATGIVLKETIQESPLLGSGPNRFVNEWLLHKPQGINSSLFWNTDFRSGVGILPTFGAMTGVLGIVAWGIFFIVFIYQGIRYLFRAPDPHTHYALFSSFSLALYLWGVSFFYVPGIAMVALACFLSGIFAAAVNRERKFKVFSLSFFKDPRVGFVSVLMLLVFVIGAFAATYFTLEKFFSLKNFQAGRSAFSAGNLEESERRIARSIAQAPSDAYYRGLAEVKASQIVSLLSRSDMSPERARAEFQDLLGSGINAGQLAVRYDTTNYVNWLALSRVYAAVTPFVKGAYENASASLSEAVSLNPQSPLLVLERARLEAANRNMAGARQYVAEALAMKPDYVDAIFFLARIEVTEGNVSQAITSLEQATLVSPNNEGLLFQLGLLRYNEKEYRDAVLSLERAVALDPQFSNARYFLGLGYHFTGRNNEAIAQFKVLEELNPGNEGVIRIRKNLENGKAPFDDSALSNESLQESGTPPIQE